MPVRLEHKYNHHYSDMHDDSGMPIGTIMCVFVDTNGNNAVMLLITILAGYTVMEHNTVLMIIQCYMI